jgi:uncharacterized GH25 family protein
MRSWILFLAVAACSFGAERVTVTGKVADASGKPVEHATVLVYEAGVKKGYSVYCPTCYPDCGKRATTDAEGNFTIGGLNGDLVFTLLVVDDGYSATFVKKVDPAKGSAAAVLKPRVSPDDPAQFVRGRVVDSHGEPVRDAVVEQQAVTFRRDDGQVATMFGGPDLWIDALAVSNQKGEFEIAFSKPAVRMILNVAPRGMASKLVTLPTGADRKTLTVTDGATVRGRLMHDGKPVADAEIGISSHTRGGGESIGEMRIGTREDGTFAITNVPAGRIYYLYGKMESLAAQGLAAERIECETKDDGQEVDLGDIQVQPAHTLRGRVALSDGKEIPPDMRINLFVDWSADAQSVVLTPGGRFEFKGLASGVYRLTPSVKGYKTVDGVTGEVLVHRDIDNLTINLQPAPLVPQR